MIPTPDAAGRVDGVSTTLAWLDAAPQYAYEGNILYAGAGLNWLAATLGLPDAAALGALAASAPDPGTAVFVPALNGIGSPWWRPDAVGTITGLTASTTRAQIARAGIDSVAHQVCDIVDALDPTRALPLLHAGGGATASEVLMQAQADLLGRTLLVSAVADISPLGAAALAWRALGVRLAPAPGLAPRLVHPSPDADARRADARDSWRHALVRAGVPRL